jgi:hypothetical protein
LAKVNYRQQKLQRERKRKDRQSEKLERRTPKPDAPVDTPAGNTSDTLIIAPPAPPLRP